ncbi:hypothetical protein MED01_002389 [Micromonospora sp. MED01]|uniref:hypothetical protein n=1 Tax=Micromonospora alfalfae TaxID=2911212 RepID=UPI001EE8FAFE|nr:hypothetical protein [Micromonospora alfalfae]MCG5464224.1 hypothetical protein [Micromonospora alfalfae]
MPVPAGGDELIFSNDLTQPVGMVRLLITDTSDVPANQLFSDEQLSALLVMEGGGVKRAAAAALDIISHSEVLISKKITTQDLSTDGPAVAAELRAQAKALREQARQDADDVAGGPDAWAISVADFDPNAAYRYGW